MSDGPKITRMTAEQLAELRAAGQSGTDWNRVRDEQARGIEPAYDPDSPDIGELIEQTVAQRRKPGRPVGSNKQLLTLRLDNEVIESFRATGDGWQTRINEVLREWVRSHR